ncbi:hypothetical protein BJ508DRAFT_25071 [Ascobolus immersus RN42]|uniref:Uncharacterized protein n=1 Tax=Ascobolus immersus RN42 TaxID=1160509 RepID=A0A3N4HSQ8_ASCIM|nr:hypothetical protein BJ508DRAFT_25071 [Ascobolus immersus RN42]
MVSFPIAEQKSTYNFHTFTSWKMRGHFEAKVHGLCFKISGEATFAMRLQTTISQSWPLHFLITILAHLPVPRASENPNSRLSFPVFRKQTTQPKSLTTLLASLPASSEVSRHRLADDKVYEPALSLHTGATRALPRIPLAECLVGSGPMTVVPALPSIPVASKLACLPAALQLQIHPHLHLAANDRISPPQGPRRTPKRPASNLHNSLSVTPVNR